jgi:tRNA A-37 threonylcarbamoyl transferase component Bud32
VIQKTHDGFRWQLADDFVPLLDRVLKAPPMVVKESSVKLVAYHEVDGRGFYVKRYRHGAHLLRPLKFLFKRSQADQEWRLATECEKRGLPIVRHLALGERWSARGLLESILITEAFEDGVPLADSHEKFFPRVMELVSEIARAGVTHHDFHPSNLLLNESTGELRLVDLHGAKICEDENPATLRDVMLVQLRGTLNLPVTEDVAAMSSIWRRNALAQRAGRCLKSNRDFTRRKFGSLNWQVRRSALGAEVQAILRDPDGFLSRGKVMKAGRSSTVGAANGFVLKRYNFKKPLNALKDLFRGSRGRRGFQKAYHLELCQFPTPRVIATADRRLLGLPLSSYILMAEIPGAVNAGQSDSPGLAKNLGLLLGWLHREGFVHRDLKETNILFNSDGVPLLIDLDGLAFVKVVSPEQTAANLQRFADGMAAAGKLTRRNFITFLRFYTRARGVPPRVLFPLETRRLHERRSR